MNLEELKTGDKVIYIGGRGAYSYELIKEVSRVTKTQIITTDGKGFRKTDGTAIGGISSFSVNKIRVLREEERVCFNNGYVQGLQEGKLIAEDWVSEAFKAMKRDLNPYTGDYGLGFNYDSMCEYMESYLKDHFGEQYYEKR